MPAYILTVNEAVAGSRRVYVNVLEVGCLGNFLPSDLWPEFVTRETLSLMVTGLSDALRNY